MDILEVNTQTFISKLIDGQINLGENVLISANELLSLMQDNLEMAKQRNEAVLQTADEVVVLRKQINSYKAELKKVNDRYTDLRSKFDTLSQIELKHRQTIELLKKQVIQSSKEMPNIKVHYAKGDLLDYVEWYQYWNIFW